MIVQSNNFKRDFKINEDMKRHKGNKCILLSETSQSERPHTLSLQQYDILEREGKTVKTVKGSLNARGWSEKGMK